MGGLHKPAYYMFDRPEKLGDPIQRNAFRIDDLKAFLWMPVDSIGIRWITMDCGEGGKRICSPII